MVRGGKGLCCVCLEIVEIIELKLDRDSKGVSVATSICRMFIPRGKHDLYEICLIFAEQDKLGRQRNV